MNEHDEHDLADQQHPPSGDAQATPEANVDRPESGDEPMSHSDEAPTHEEDEPADEAVIVEDEPVEAEPDVDLDDALDATPTDAVADSLKEALGSMREEADRIASLGTGEDQVAAAEQFAEDAGKLDEQVGASARAADADGS